MSGQERKRRDAGDQDATERGSGRGPGRGFHWLFLLGHRRCFWHLANLTEAEPVVGARARTVLKWPFQDPHPELLLECRASESGFRTPRASFKELLASAAGELGTLVLEAEARGSDEEGLKGDSDSDVMQGGTRKAGRPPLV